jgi:uncharacterized membrane protein YccC
MVTQMPGSRAIPPAIGRWLGRLLPLEMAEFSLSAGIRAAVAVAVPVLFGEILRRPDLSWIAIVAFWGCLVDPGGAWRERFRMLALFTGIASLGVALAALAEPHAALAVALAFFWCFGASFIRVLGAAATSLGVLSVTDLLVSLGLPPATPPEFLGRVAYTIVGGAWAMLLVLILWRLHPHGPARDAVSRCWQRLGAYADALARLEQLATAAESADDWAAVMRTYRSPTREAIEAARNVVSLTRRQSGGRVERNQSLLLLLAEAERGFETMVALSELLQVAHSFLPATAERGIAAALRRFAREAENIGATLRDSRIRRGRDLAPLIARLGGRLGTASPLAAPIRHLAEELGRSVATARDVAAGVLAPERLADAIQAPAAPVKPAAVMTTLRDNLSWESLYFRHALRLALTVALGEGIVAALALPRGYWLTMTAAVVLQPFLATTWRRTLERVGGSVIGGAIAAAISVNVVNPVLISVLVIPLSIATLAVRSVNYTIFVLCLTPQFILIAELFQPCGLGSWELAGLRALDSLVGGALGLAAAFLLWPAREALILRPRLAAAVAGNRRFLAAATAPQPDPDAIHGGRRAAGLASNNAEASIQRLVGEPRGRSDLLLEPAMSIVTCCRRLGGGAAAVAAMRLGIAQPLPIARSLAWLDGQLKAIAQGLKDGTAIDGAEPPDEASGEDAVLHEVFEIIRQTATLRDAANRFIGAEKGAGG